MDYSGGSGGWERVCCPPLSNYWGGLAHPSSYTFVYFIFATNIFANIKIKEKPQTSKTRISTRNTLSEIMKREPSKEWDMKKKTHHFALFSSYNLTGHLPGLGNIRYWLHVSGIVHILYRASPKPCKIMKREPSKEWDMKKNSPFRII